MALLALGEAAPAAFPVPVSIEGHGSALQVSVDGQSHALNSQLGAGEWRGVLTQQPGPAEHEYQIDGSDTTSTIDLQPQVLARLLDTPVYRIDAWLRDEPSLSRWEHLRVTDLATGANVDPGTTLPRDFRVDVDLRRPEGPARVWLLGPDDLTREGLELDRDRRNARWVTLRNGNLETLPRWFFPEQPAPFAAELVHMLGRVSAAAFVLTTVAFFIARATERVTTPTLFRGLTLSRFISDSVLALWLLASVLVSVRLYHQLPHILDAVSYTFEAGLLASGRLTLPAPPHVDAFKGPFEALARGRLFSQYPPGAPAVYALGRIVSMEWLVGPLCGVLLLAATAGVARKLYGAGTGLVVLALGALSPFVLFQSGSFLSHPVAAALLAAALFSYVTAHASNRTAWYVATGALLGAAFATREVASILFAVPIAIHLVLTRNIRRAMWIVLAGLPFLGLYLLYNWQVTGSPVLLPRQVFDPSDRFGFGDGIGFHTRHTLAAGLVNTDELLTSLQFELFGWPPLCALAVLSTPFLFRRAQRWDYLALAGFLAFVVAYIGYFYHGIALGPRYYFEAMPYILLLAGRGVVVMADVARSRAAAFVVVAALFAYALTFYLPLEIQRRADLSGMPAGRRVNLAFVDATPFGPRLNVPNTPALVLTGDWWLYNTSLSALNCPELPNCDVLFALATNQTDEAGLRAQFPNRALFHAIDSNGRITLAQVG